MVDNWELLLHVWLFSLFEPALVEGASFFLLCCCLGLDLPAPLKSGNFIFQDGSTLVSLSLSRRIRKSKATQGKDFEKGCQSRRQQQWRGEEDKKKQAFFLVYGS